MRLKGLPLQRLVIGISIIVLLSTFSSAISVRSRDKKSKDKLKEKVFIDSDDESGTTSEKLLDRQGHFDEDQFMVDSHLNSRDLVKKSENVSEAKPSDKNKKKDSENSLPGGAAASPTEPDIDADDNSAEDGEKFVKTDLRGDKKPRIYYDDTAPRYSHAQDSSGGESPFEPTAPDGKQSEGKFYFPKNYLDSKHIQSQKKSHNPTHHLAASPGKRIPDHVQFDEGSHGSHAHDFPASHSHAHEHPAIGHLDGRHHHHDAGHEEGPFGHGHGDDEHHHGKGPFGHGHGDDEHHHGKGPFGHGHGDDDHHHGKSPFGHGHGGDEHHHGKGHHHVSGYGYNHHYGSYRHTIGDKVDAVGKALQVLIPSAILFTGVSALFPNRVHVPTTPINKLRQKRSVFSRRVSDRGMVPVPPLARLPSAHIPPEMEDIPSHILRAEHRIMEGEPVEMYPEYGKRVSSSDENPGFNPFKVFKGPGPEATANKIQDAIPMPLFPEMPDMGDFVDKSNEYVQLYQGMDDDDEEENPRALTKYQSESEEPLPPTVPTPKRIIPQVSQPTTNLDENFIKQRQNIMLRVRTTARKPPVFVKETTKVPVRHSSESRKSQYVVESVKNTIDMTKKVNHEKAEQEFMSSMQNLVTPDVAKAIVESKKDPPKDVDLSPDGPVMGLLTSYAQHENDSPACQKRALCEMAVKGKGPKSTKFEAFLWSVATLVPDMFSQMYDLQEVFHAIRDEQCLRFACVNPNMDIQAK